MPSSSWRLIRNGGPPQGQGTADSAAVSATSEPFGVKGSSATILRGLGRSGGHGSGRGGPNPGSGGMQGGLPGYGGNVDQAVLAEELERLEREAEERGYEAGRNRAEAELRAAVDGASALADRLQAIAPERTSEVAHSIAELALAVAKRILQHEVRIEPSLLCAALEAAVSTINGSPEARVLLNPAAVEPVQQAWEALHGRAYLGKKWFFEGDPTLAAGGCTLRYEHGFVEAGLEAQLEEIGIALDRAIPNLARGAVEEEVA
jgi:flagellar biosynthesis/type III secretory pathway protein FliH